MRWWRSGLVVAQLFGSLAPAGIAGQAARVIDDRATCAACTFSLERVVTLRTDEGAGTLLGDPQDIRRDSRGRYYVLDFRDKTHILVFNADGSFTASIGRAGDGPGEFSDLRQVLIGTPGDSIIAVEAHRISVFDSSGSFVRSFPTDAGPRYDAALMPNRDILVAGGIPTPSRIGLPLHLVTPTGEITASFGSDGTFRPDQMGFGRATIDVDSSGLITSVQRQQYVISRWAPDQSYRGLFVRRTRWFPATPPGSATLSPSNPGPPLVQDVRSRRGETMVLITVPHPEWSKRLPPPEDYRGTPVYRLPRGGGLFQTRIEVLDLARASLLATTTVDDEITGFIDPDLAYSARETPQGSLLVDIWRVRFNNPGSFGGGSR